jgi:hypothetical protein
LSTTPEKAAKTCVAIADRLERLRPSSHDPEKYFSDKSEIVGDLVALARELAPARSNPRKPPDSIFRSGEVLSAKGRRIVAETRGGRRVAESSNERLKRAVFG